MLHKGYEILQELSQYISDEDIIVSSNGNISREVFNLLPQPQVYLRGSMGLPLAVGLGLALANPDRRVIVITGDGNFLMGLSTITTISHYKPKNLKIIILDNGSYLTTGGQETTSWTLNYNRLFSALDIGHGQYRGMAPAESYGEVLALNMKQEELFFLNIPIAKEKMSFENIPWHPEDIAKKIIERIAK